MKKILLGFLAIGLLTIVGCDKDDDTDIEMTDSTETSSDNGSTASDTGSDDEGTDTDSGDGTTDDSSVEYGEGATDIDGNTYQSVIIGEQEWFAENLRTSKYSDGTVIPNVTDDAGWENYSETAAWCNYKNDNQYDTIYGKLYNWYAVETGKLCPTGWHVPTDSEWTELTDYLAANGHNRTEGKALKATSGWNSGGNGTDDYGWLGLPGGMRDPNAGLFLFHSVGSTGYWWSSSQDDTDYALHRYLGDNLDNVGSYNSNSNKYYGFSVRCLRD